MAKITSSNITVLGFKREMYGFTTGGELTALIDGVIAEQSLILSGRLGATAYNSATSPMKEYVKRAELCMVAAEMLQRRINIILGNVIGAGAEIGTANEDKQIGRYRAEVEMLIARIAAGISADSDGFASAILSTSHFETTASLSGLEQ